MTATNITQFEIRSSTQDGTIAGRPAIRTVLVLWNVTEDHPATAEELQQAYENCSGYGYHVMARLSEPAGEAFSFGIVTAVFDTGFVQVSETDNDGNIVDDRMYTYETFHRLYEVD